MRTFLFLTTAYKRTRLTALFSSVVALTHAVTCEQAAAQINTIRKELARLKTVEQVEVLQPLTDCQAAGWVDSDGCIQLDCYGVAQKYPQILHAFRKAYGGTVTVARDPEGKYPLWVWRIGANTKEGKAFAARVFPRLIEKCDQGRIVLSSTVGTRKGRPCATQQLERPPAWPNGRGHSTRRLRGFL